MLINELVATASYGRDNLDLSERKETLRFVKSCWNRDGGARGRSSESDLYYTVFAAMCMRALGGRAPRFRLWRYVRSFGDGSSLDLVHLFCFVRLRSVFPMTQSARARLMELCKNQETESAADLFFKVYMSECLGERNLSCVAVEESQTTSNLAAAVVLNHCSDNKAKRWLMDRYAQTGGFCSDIDGTGPCLEATAKALFALRVLGMDLSSIIGPSRDFVESLRCADGSYRPCATDPGSDVESTFYALFSLGALACAPFL